MFLGTMKRGPRIQLGKANAIELCVLQDSLTLPTQKHISRHRILHLNYWKYEGFDLYLCKTSECEHIASQGLVSYSGNVFSVL